MSDKDSNFNSENDAKQEHRIPDHLSITTTTLFVGIHKITFFKPLFPKVADANMPNTSTITKANSENS